MNDQEKIVKYLLTVEKLADELIANRRKVVAIDARRNELREAMRSLSNPSQKKCWLSVGSILIKHDINHTRSLLEADQKQLNIDLNKIRSDMKVQYNELRDLEMLPPIPGLMLVPISQIETSGLAEAGLFFL